LPAKAFSRTPTVTPDTHTSNPAHKTRRSRLAGERGFKSPNLSSDTPHTHQPTQIRRSRLAGERALPADERCSDTPQSRAWCRYASDVPASSRASSLPQGRRLLRDSAASGRPGNSHNSRPAQNRVRGKSLVGAIGGYDGREDGRSVTSMVLGTPQSRASALLHIARQPALSISQGGAADRE
jgi:hypothetical protein